MMHVPVIYGIHRAYMQFIWRVWNERGSSMVVIGFQEVSAKAS